MRESNLFAIFIILLMLVGLSILTQCNNKSGLLESDYAPEITSTIPGNNERDISITDPVSASFSEEMDPSTINPETFILLQNSDTIAGNVSYSDCTAVFRPFNPLNYDREYTAKITTGVESIDGNALYEAYSWNFTTRSEPEEPDSSPPRIFSTNPVNEATDVSVTITVMANFNEPINPKTVNGSSFILQHQGETIPGTVSYSNNTASFNPDEPLDYTSDYTAIVTTQIEDRSGNTMEEDYTWTFTTQSEAEEEETDETPPEIESTNPGNNAADVPINSSITADFSERMEATTINTSSFTLTLDGTPIAGSVSYAGRRATFNPNDNMEYEETYVATITTDAADEAGNNLRDTYEWSFTTEDAPDQEPTDDIPPEVESVNPDNNETNVNVNTNITADFNEPLAAATINASSFILLLDGATVSGNIFYSGQRATFVPNSDLTYEQTYRAVITTDVTDQAGNNMTSDFDWTFTTEDAPDNDPPTIINFSPDEDADNVPVETAVSVDFSEPMDASSINGNTFLLSQNGQPVSGSVEYADETATFIPDDNLSYETTYSAELTSAVQDQNGNALTGNTEWSFTTEVEPTPPVIMSRTPEPGADEVDPEITIQVTFSEVMNPQSINSTTFQLERSNGPPDTRAVEGEVEVEDDTAFFEPEDELEEDSHYITTLSSEIEDSDGDPLGENISWEFETWDDDDDDDDDDD